MAFTFIDNNSPLDSASRRRIRKHAATGKNLGRKLAPRARRKGGKASEALHDAAVDGNQEIWNYHEVQTEKPDDIERPVGDHHALLPLPSKEAVSPQNARLIDKMLTLFKKYPIVPGLEFALDPHSMRAPSIWFEMAFIDEAYFHCSVAISIITLNKTSVLPEDPAEALRRVGKTFSLINERMAKDNEESISDNTIATVVTIAKFDFAAGNTQQGHMHLDGLQRMVDLRGGITTLASHNSVFTQKIFRLDLEWSLCLGTATRFGEEDFIQYSRSLVGLDPSNRPTKDSERALAQVLEQLNLDLREQLLDTIHLSQILGAATTGRGPKVHNYDLHDTMLLLGYRLIRICPLARSLLQGHMDKAVHIGLVAYLTTFLPGFDGKVPENPFLPQLVIAVVTYDHDSDDAQDIQMIDEVMLWNVFIGRVANIIGSDNDSWLMSKLEQLATRLSLQTWDDVKAVVSKFPWMSVLHDKPGRELWQRFLSYQSSQSIVHEKSPVPA